MRKFSLKIGIDVDGVLMECVELACQYTNKELGTDLKAENLKSYSLSGTEFEPIAKWFNKPHFVRNQKPYVSSGWFLKELQKRAEVFIITAVPPEVMSERARSLMKYFPMIPKENIIIGTRKELVDVDIMLDDCPSNIVDSNTSYPVLMRKPWNQGMTGCLAVNNYAEFLTLVDTILSNYTNKESVEGNKLYCLVGPSASGKTAILEELLRQNKAVRVPSYTTRPPRLGEVNGESYHFISEKQFQDMKNSGKFFETTTYANNHYGSCKEDIEVALEKDNVVMALDICGAIAMKRLFPENATIVFIKRDKRVLIEAILERDVSNEEKTNRIISLSDELKNEDLADIVIYNNKSLEEIVDSYF
mgnify:FL=1